MKCEYCKKEHDGSFGSGRFCNKSCCKGFATSKNKEARNKKISNKLKGDSRCAWNKKSENEYFNIICPTCKNEFKTLKRNQIFCSRICKDTNPEYRKKLSDSMKKNPKAGGKRQGSGRGKSGWYKGYWCDSSYELAWVIYNIDHDIKFERNNKGFEYNFNNEIHKFYPDFILEDNTYVEIKGFMTEQNKAKIEQFQYNLIVIMKNDLKNIFEYVENKYGSDYIKLYENNPHKIELRKCIKCGKLSKNKYCSKKCGNNRNTNLGKVYVYNLDLKQSKSIEKNKLQDYLNNGWIKGRKLKF